MNAAGMLGNAVALDGGAACCAPTLCFPFNRYFTPRKSPDPSSPTVAANRMGRVTGTRAATIASATATNAARPRALPEMPGPSSRWPRGAGPVGGDWLMDGPELSDDWSRAGGEGGPAFDWSRGHVDLNDETLRDGLQSPSVRDPALEVKKRLLHLMADLGIVAADIGLPGAGPRVVEQVRALATEIRNAKLPIAPNCAARTVIADIEPIVRVAQEVGIAIEAATFIGSSAIRAYG